jgi:hypothetical protein
MVKFIRQSLLLSYCGSDPESRVIQHGFTVGCSHTPNANTKRVLKAASCLFILILFCSIMSNDISQHCAAFIMIL